MAAGRVRRQHTLAIDDAPFDKHRDHEAWVVGVVTAGGGLVEGVMTTRVPVDGGDVTERLAQWILASRFRPSLRAVLFEGITIAGLSVIDIAELSSRLALPVISVDRRRPEPGKLETTLAMLDMAERISAIRGAGALRPFRQVFYASAGASQEASEAILEQNAGRSYVPEGLRLAHLIGQAIARGESRGRP